MRDLVAVARHVEPVERLHRRFRLAFGRAERGEVVLADQPLRGRVHRLGVERARHAPGAAAIEREIGAAVDDAIEIVALASPRSARRNRPATFSAESTATGCGRRCALSASRTLSVSQSLARSTCATCPSACTPASVRPAPCTCDLLAAERLDRLRQRRPAPTAVVLDLPADERRAVIFDGELVARHGRRHRSTCRLRPACRAGIPPPSSAACRRAALR